MRASAPEGAAGGGGGVVHNNPSLASRNVSCSAADPIGWGSRGPSQSGPRGSASWAGTLQTLQQGPPPTEPQAQLTQRPADGLLSAGQRRLHRCWVLSAQSPRKKKKLKWLLGYTCWMALASLFTWPGDIQPLAILGQTCPLPSCGEPRFRLVTGHLRFPLVGTNFI